MSKANTNTQVPISQPKGNAVSVFSIGSVFTEEGLTSWEASAGAIAARNNEGASVLGSGGAGISGGVSK
jgi:hypothetical protein